MTKEKQETEVLETEAVFVAAAEDVAMVVTREGYTRHGVEYGIGQVVFATEAGAKAMEAASPAWGRRAKKSEIPLAAAAPWSWRGRPDAPASAVAEAPTINATQAAVDRAEQVGFNIRAFDGRGSGDEGRITVADVNRWSKEQGLIAE